MNSQLIGKDPDAGKAWTQKEREAAEDEMVGWHHRFNGHELGQTLGDGDRQGGLVCCSPWGHRVRHDLATEETKSPLSVWFSLCYLQLIFSLAVLLGTAEA